MLALWTNEQGRVVRRHYQPDTLGPDELDGATVATVPEPPVPGRGQRAVLYVQAGQAVWQLDPRPLTLDEKLEDRAVEAAGVERWTMPTGAHDAPGVGDHRWHDGRVWRSTIVGNTVEPGTHPGFDWWVETGPPAVPDRLRGPLEQMMPDVAAAQTVPQLRAAVTSILETLTGSAPPGS